MDPLVDVIAVVPHRFEEIIEKTKNAAVPWDEEMLTEVYERNNAQNKYGYIMIQTVMIVQVYEEAGNEETGQVVPAPSVEEGEANPSEAGATPR